MILRRIGVAALLVAAGAAAQAADGVALFKQHCAVCHQENAGGTVGLAPTLLGEHWQRLGAERQYIPMVMLKGMSGTIKVAGQPFSGSMPPFAPQLNDDDLAAIATHLRGLQGTKDFKPYAADEFAAVRAAAGNPVQSRTLRKQILGD